MSEIIDAGCDYLRMTVRPGHGLKNVLHVFEDMESHYEDLGYERTKWNWQGYEGHTIGAVYRGTREDGMIFEARGASGNVAIAKLKGVEFDGNIARLDAQASIAGKAENTQSLESLFNTCRMAGVETSEERRRNLVFHRQRNAKDTIYVGSRNSSSYLCIYCADAKHPDRYCQPTRRFEVRYSNETARERFTHFQNAASITCVATSLVVGHCMSVGLQRSWFKESPPIHPMPCYTPKSFDKSFNWIEKYCAKTVKQLIAAGYGDRLAKAFGVVALEPTAELRASETFKSAAKKAAKIKESEAD